MAVETPLLTVDYGAVALADAIPATPVLGETVSSHDGDETISLWANGIREPDDPVLKGRGAGSDLRLYDQVRTDAQVWPTLQQRRDSMLSLPWDVKPGDPDDVASVAAAEELKDQLEGIELYSVLRKMHWGVFYGYAVGEVIWTIDNSRIVIDAVKVRRARRFGFDVDGHLMLRGTVGSKPERMPDAKFWVATTGADTDDEPYGLGLAHLLYWPVYFKRHGLKAWMTALDKFAVPTAFGTYPPGTSQEDINKLLVALKAIRMNSAFVHPEGMTAGLLEASKSAGMDFKKFHDYLDAGIAKIVNSQTMTTDDGASLSQAEVHERVGDKVSDSDASLLCDAFNRGPSTWWTEWNYGDRAKPPILTLQEPDVEDVEAAVNRDEKLSNMGWQPTEERIETVYGTGYERRDRPQPTVPGLPPPTPPALADAGTDAITDLTEAVLADGSAPAAVNDMLAPLVELMDGAETLDEFQTALDDLSLSDASLEPFQEHLAQAMFAARIGGEVGAEIRDGVTSEEA